MRKTENQDTSTPIKTPWEANRKICSRGKQKKENIKKAQHPQTSSVISPSGYTLGGKKYEHFPIRVAAQ